MRKFFTSLGAAALLSLTASASFAAGPATSVAKRDLAAPAAAPVHTIDSRGWRHGWRGERWVGPRWWRYRQAERRRWLLEQRLRRGGRHRFGGFDGPFRGRDHDRHFDDRRDRGTTAERSGTGRDRDGRRGGGRDGGRDGRRG